MDLYFLYYLNAFVEIEENVQIHHIDFDLESDASESQTVTFFQ